MSWHGSPMNSIIAISAANLWLTVLPKKKKVSSRNSMHILCAPMNMLHVSKIGEPMLLFPMICCGDGVIPSSLTICPVGTRSNSDMSNKRRDNMCIENKN